jgi:hypothetical protein
MNVAIGEGSPFVFGNCLLVSVLHNCEKKTFFQFIIFTFPSMMWSHQLNHLMTKNMIRNRMPVFSTDSSKKSDQLPAHVRTASLNSHIFNFLFLFICLITLCHTVCVP